MQSEAAENTGVKAPLSPWSGRVVLVTGCTGFLGSWLSRTLCDSGAKLIGLVHNAIPGSGLFSVLGLQDRIEIVNGDIGDYPLLERMIVAHGVETIFHLAGQSQVSVARQRPRVTLDVNVRGTWNMLEAARISERPIRVVVSSTEAVYGDSRRSTCFEYSPLRATAPYAVSKLCCEHIARMYNRSYGLAVSAARCSNLYGGGDPNSARLVPSTIQSIMHDEAPVIRGNSQAAHNYLYVDDAVHAYLALVEAMDRPGVAGKTFNFSSDQAMSVEKIVQTILELMGRDDLKPVILDRNQGTHTARFVSSRKAERRLGWSAQVPLETGLNKTIEWYRGNHRGRF